jgi:predicted amidohydrolase
MKLLNIALVQMKSEKGQVSDNLKAIENYIKESKSKEADVICFPEMSITGYIDPSKYPESVLSIDSSAIEEIIQFSKNYSILIIAGFVEKNSNKKPFITQVAAYEGELVGVYRKNTVIDEEAQWFTGGIGLCSFKYKGVNIGLSICADIENEKLFHEYGKLGVDIVFESAAPGLYGEQDTRNWESGFNWGKGECYNKLGEYAKENQMYIVVSTQAGRTIDEDFPGGGYVFSGEGQCMCETDDWSEGVLCSTISFKD